jgi:NAD(P)-dependent dehydrogenase (short-subunit alcohol dehydrogenase family)
MTFSAKDIPDMSGKVVIVTGANVGLGYHSALEIARKGGHVFMACRSKERADKAITDIKMEIPNAKVEFMELDLQDINQVKAAAESWLTKGLPLHVLMNNAGIMATPFALTKQGIESQFGTNHMGHFTLTQFLLPRIIESQPSRIVNLSSYAHNFAPAADPIPLPEKINDEKAMSPWERYGVSKLSNILFSVSLDEKLKEQKVYVNACHPGAVATELIRGPINTYGTWVKGLWGFLGGLISVKPDFGALTQLYLATSPEVETLNIRGKYLVPTAKLHIPSKAAQDPQLAKKLWEFSESFLNEHLSP